MGALFRGRHGGVSDRGEMAVETDVKLSGDRNRNGRRRGEASWGKGVRWIARILGGNEGKGEYEACHGGKGIV